MKEGAVLQIPILNNCDVENIINNCKVVGNPMKGGQKLVFPCEISGKKCAAKFILLFDDNDEIDDNKAYIIDTIVARAKRELEIMNAIDSPNVVKLVDPQLTQLKYKNQNLLLYLEEWIDGVSVDRLIKSGSVSIDETIRLCIDITKAISHLWGISVVHRDIKPQNIIRKSDGTYVLLDMGLAFDLEDKSLTMFGFVPGTKMYFSPEQLDISNKRNIDFRSDLFSLGIVMYQLLTGIHPFYDVGITDKELFDSICYSQVEKPSIINTDIPLELSNIVFRLLNKQPSGRYRKCDFLLIELNELLNKLEVAI